MKHSLFIFLALVTIVSCGGRGRAKEAEVKPAAEIVKYGVEVVNSYPHDRGNYTQGLFFHENRLYESTGEYGKSSFITYSDFKTGKRADTIRYSDEYFMEGAVLFKDKIYLLTWTNAVVLVYDAATMEQIRTIRYPRQGWGLTTDGEQLIASDGSSKLYFLDENMNVKESKVVRRRNTPVPYLNELEYIDGKIWANVYTTDEIVIIDPETCKVEASIDCTGLLDDGLRQPDTDVLNGIAWNPVDKKIYLTGKNWPSLFEVRLVRK